MIDIKELKYTKDHEWVSVENDIAIVGITDFAQSELGDIIFVEFPNVDDSFKKNESLGTLEAVKTVADIFCPVSGRILELNTKLEDSPELINSSPYEDGWIVKIRIDNKDELNDLLDLDSYNKII